MKKIIAAIAALVTALMLAACSHQSDTVSENLSNQADQYHVFRQIVVYNGITDKYILEVEGWCALGNNDDATQTTYTCKTPRGYVKDVIKKSDNTFVFVHQLKPLNVSDTFFQVTLRPESVIPNIQFQ